MKKKQKLFDQVLQIVANETEIAPEIILSANKTVEVVDARHIFVKALLECGLYPGTVALLTGVSPQAVGKIRNEFDTRLKTNSKILRTNYNNIINELKTHYLL